MATSGVIHNVLRAVNLPVDIRNICVLLAPGFSAFTAWATYMFVTFTNYFPALTRLHQVHKGNEG
jgi:hypothetical protein